MSENKHTYHQKQRRKFLSPWFFFAAALVFSLVSVVALRQNNVGMIELRDKVYKADKENKSLEEALRELRVYVYSHMNTNLAAGSNGIYPPIQLKYEYERLIQAEEKRIAKVNEKIYPKAQAFCEKKFPEGLSGGNRIPCIEDYVAKRGEEQNPIDESLYKFDFASPRWSPDIAGISLLAAGISGVLFIVLWVSDKIARFQLRE